LSIRSRKNGWTNNYFFGDTGVGGLFGVLVVARENQASIILVGVIKSFNGSAEKGSVLTFNHSA